MTEKTKQSAFSNGDEIAVPSVFDTQLPKHRKLGEQAPEPIIKDLEHRFVAVSQEFADLLGMTVNDVIGKNDLEVGIPESVVLGKSELAEDGLWALEDQAIAAASGCASQADREDVHSVGIRDAQGTLRIPLYDDKGSVVALQILPESLQCFGASIGLKTKQDAPCLERREGHLNALEDMLTSLVGHLNQDQLFLQVAQTIQKHTLANNVYIWMLDDSTEFMEVVTSIASDQNEPFLGKCQKGEGIAGSVWEDANTAFIDANSTGRYKRPEQLGEKQMCVVPLMADGEVLGLIMAASNSEKEDIKPEIILIERIASIASIAFKNTLLMASTRAELIRTRALSELSGWLSTISDPTADTDVVCRTLLDTIEITRASYYQADDHGVLQHMVSWALTPMGVSRVPPLANGFVDETICQWCFNNGKPAQISRNNEDPRESARIHTMRQERNIGSTACMPISYSGKTVGTLLISRKRDLSDFDENEINIFRAIVQQLSTAIERHELSSALRHQASHDNLTRLPNRRQFENELDLYCQSVRSLGMSAAILFMDLDGFKMVNDTLGHAVGDELLKQVSKRLSDNLRSCDFLARMGGDEFAVIVKNIQQPDSAIDIAYRMASALSDAFIIDEAHLRVETSIGISRFPEDSEDTQELLRKADVAMYQAKSNGKGQILYFDQKLSTSVCNRAQLEFELQEAISQNQFRLVYQPQVNCKTGRVDNVEALIRWAHPVRGTVSPFHFISVAEEAGLIHAIGAWVLEEAVSQLAKWRNTHLTGVRVAVNIAASQFQMDNFCDLVLETLERHNVPAGLLELEVTESVVMKDLKAVANRLRILREAGVRIAIDDFGTGYSSLSYLQDLPLDVLKIDRSFILRLQHEKMEQSLVNTILLLASGLGLETVAEGVETLEQQAKVVSMGCSYIQGYYYSMPVAPDVLLSAVREINGSCSSAA